MDNKTDAQTANEEQVKVSGVLEGGNTYTDGGVDHLSGTHKQEFSQGETIHPYDSRVAAFTTTKVVSRG